MAKRSTNMTEREAAKAAMKWYGWGSPIGLSIFLFVLVIVAAIFKEILFG